MLVTDDEGLARRARLFAHQGLTRDSWARYSHNGFWQHDVAALGFKYNMSDVLASLGIHQLARLPHLTEARQRIARQYQQLFESVPEIVVPQALGEVSHVWHLFVIRLRTEMLSIDRGRFIELMRERGIATSVHYIPIHYHSAYCQRFGDLRGQFPNTESAYEGIVSLPIYPSLTEAQVQRVGETAIDIIRRHRR
jgi:dTDP-4-amino-4,6-dideoxygalactose transaminase